jgi:nitronate monooxygenase
LKNAVSDEVVAMERRPGGCRFEDIRPLVAGARGRAALESGDIDGGLVWAGLTAGLIDDIPTCKDLIERIVAQCRERIASAAAIG